MMGGMILLGIFIVLVSLLLGYMIGRRRKPQHNVPHTPAEDKGILDIIARTSASFNTAKSASEIYNIVTDTVSTLIPDAYLILTERLENDNAVRIKTITGIDIFRKQIDRILGAETLGASYDILDIPGDEQSDYASGELIEIPGKLYPLSAQRISKTICSLLETMLGISAVYIISFSYLGKIFGGLTIALKRDATLRNREAVTSIVQQASIVLHRMRSDEALKKSEERLRSLVEAIPYPIFSKGADLRYELCNQAFSDYLGIEKKKIIGSTVFDISPKENAEMYDKADRELLASRKMQQYESHVRYNDGTEHDVIFYKGCYFDIRGEIAGMVGLIFDITDRKRTEAALALSETRFRELADLLPQAIFETDTAGILTYGNRDAYTATGYTDDDVRGGLNVIDIIIPADRDRCRNNMQKSITGVRAGNEYTAIRKDGTTYPVIIYSSPIMRDGKFAGFRGILLDITDRKTMENAVKFSEEKFATTFHSTPDAIIISRLSDTMIIDVNKGFEKLTGYTAEEAIGNSVANLNLWANDDTRNRFLHLLRIEGRCDNFEDVLTCKNGSIRNSSVSARIIHIGGEACILSVTHDITERKQMEIALRESEQKFRQVVESAPWGMHFCELRDDKIIFVGANPFAERILGRDHRPFIGKSIDEVFPVIREPDIASIYKTIAQKGGIWTTEQVNYDNGKIKNAFEVFAFQTAPNKMVASFSDISDRMKAQQELQEKTDELDRFFNSTLDLLCIADTDGFFRRLNPAWETTLGYMIEELEGKKFLDLVHPDDIPATLQTMRTLDGQHEVLNFTNRYRHKNGSYRHLEWRSFPSGNLVYASARDITDRITMESALGESEKRYRTIVENLNDAYIRHDFNGTINGCNEIAYRIHGYTEEEFIGRHLSEITSPKSALLVKQRLQELVERGSIEFDAEHIRKDGSVIPVSVSARVVTESGGGVIQSFVRDITERVAMEAALKESEQRFRSIFDESPYPITLSRLPDGIIVDVNKEFTKATGMTPEMARGRMASELGIMRTEDDAALTASLMEYGVIGPVELPAGTSSNPRVGLIIAKRIEINGVQYSLAMVQDITDRKRAEEALRASEEKYRSLVANMPDIVLVHINGRIIYINDTARAVTGYSAEELLGTSVLDYVDKDDAALMMNIAGKRLDGEQVPDVYEQRFITKNGGIRDLEVRVALISYEGERANLVVLTDITERKKTEEQLRRYTADLERSNRDLEDFAYIASHDLQEPLRKVQAFGDRLKQKCLPILGDDGANYIEHMSSSTKRMQQLINDLLAYSRVGANTHLFAPINLTETVEEAMSALDVKRAETKAVISFNALPVIDADRMQMTQLFQNLLSNALKFRSADIAPEIRITARDIENDMIEISVSDNGIGFDEKYLNKIFTIFQRLHPREAYEGTGAGLAICKKIVTHHGGSITAASSPGNGATFIIRLPRRHEAGSER
ncbi:MAG: PAS domain S-box protein [Spirochaetes bacterium]|nr:PAS domain S-box protein [Spirochaetota bacterium]